MSTAPTAPPATVESALHAHLSETLATWLGHADTAIDVVGTTPLVMSVTLVHEVTAPIQATITAGGGQGPDAPSFGRHRQAAYDAQVLQSLERWSQRRAQAISAALPAEASADTETFHAPLHLAGFGAAEVVATLSTRCKAGCNGTGAQACGYCHATGRRPCQACHQTGKANCPSCHGNTFSTQRCHSCHGSGTQSQTIYHGSSSSISTVTCPGCNGSPTTRLICFGCNGQGQVACSLCAGTQHVACPYCSAGRIRCDSCAGTGVCFEAVTLHAPVRQACTVQFGPNSPRWHAQAWSQARDRLGSLGIVKPAPVITSIDHGTRISRTFALPYTAALVAVGDWHGELLALGPAMRISAFGSLGRALLEPALDQLECQLGMHPPADAGQRQAAMQAVLRSPVHAALLQAEVAARTGHGNDDAGQAAAICGGVVDARYAARFWRGITRTVQIETRSAHAAPLVMAFMLSGLAAIACALIGRWIPSHYYPLVPVGVALAMLWVGTRRLRQRGALAAIRSQGGPALTKHVLSLFSSEGWFCAGYLLAGALGALLAFQLPTGLAM